jgi:hypothetical protein
MTCVNVHRTYPVPECDHSQRYFFFFLFFVFSLAEHKNEKQIKWEVPLGTCSGRKLLDRSPLFF